jgi:S1-C subfamily serine protease
MPSTAGPFTSAPFSVAAPTLLSRRIAVKRLGLTVFAGLCAYLGGLTAQLSLRGLPPLFAQAPPAAREVTALGDRFESIAGKLAPTVVAVDAVKPVVNKAGKRSTTDDSGSGVLVRLPGRKGVFVITNNHVINQAAPRQITINLADNRILKPARVWADPESDIAVLQLDDDRVPTAPLGNSDRVRVGQWVLAFGSPFGLNQTVTHGIISARERGQVSLGESIRIKDFLQTDAAINPGSSGGALVNLDGEVIGINTAIASPSGSNTGVAFSIPINMVKRIAGQLLDKGAVTRGYLGVQLTPGFESTVAVRLGLNKAEGALVDSVHPESPAAAAGLRKYDVLLEVNGQAVRNENQFINRISGLAPGARARLKVWRDRRAITVDTVIGDWEKAKLKLRK